MSVLSTAAAVIVKQNSIFTVYFPFISDISHGHILKCSSVYVLTIMPKCKCILLHIAQNYDCLWLLCFALFTKPEAFWLLFQSWVIVVQSHATVVILNPLLLWAFATIIVWLNCVTRKTWPVYVSNRSLPCMDASSCSILDVMSHSVYEFSFASNVTSIPELVWLTRLLCAMKLAALFVGCPQRCQTKYDTVHQ